MRRESSWVSGSVAIATGYPPIDATSPNRALPTRRRRRAPRSPTIVTLSPSLKPFLVNVFVSSATSPLPVGARPETKRNCSNGAGCSDETKLTPPLTASPDRSRIDTSPKTEPAAACTPGVARRRSTSASSSGGGVSEKSLSTLRGTTTTSVPAFACAKMSVKDLLIVSVRT
ncbi:MAG: hypothetical protein QOI48_3621 [Solirubrobacteraceae bacterium]|nr:hypothetical protein [Solirubrobacteraceae bacterium]